MNSNDNTNASVTVTEAGENGRSKIIKLIVGFVIAALVSVILVLAVKCSTETTIKIEDPVIEQLVCAKLNHDIGYITTAEAETVTELDLSGVGIEDFSELAKLPNLRSLDLSGNSYTHIVLPQGLKLESLDISGNRIKDLSFLSSLSTLKSLNAENNLIKDLSPLSSLHSLTALQLDGNLIRDLSPVASLLKLEQLSLSDNKLMDISALSQLTALKSLDLSNNQISDITPLNTLAALESLNLSRNPYADLSPVAQLPVVLSGNVTE